MGKIVLKQNLKKIYHNVLVLFGQKYKKKVATFVSCSYLFCNYSFIVLLYSDIATRAWHLPIKYNFYMFEVSNL